MGSVAQKMNKAKGPTAFLVPLRGWLSMEKESYSGPAMKLFADALKAKLKPEIQVIEVDPNIDDHAFALVMKRQRINSGGLEHE